MYLPLNEEQAKTRVDALQLFEQYQAHLLRKPSVAGSMHWRKSGGHEYLYRAVSGRVAKSLGRRSAKTEALKEQFEEGKANWDSRKESLEDTLKTHAAYVRANGLNRLPVTAARVLRALQKHDIPYRVIGTNALYAYESRAGALMDGPLLATGDLDVLFDARQSLQVISKAPQNRLLNILQQADKTFVKRTSGRYEFSASADSGYQVDFVTQGQVNEMLPTEFERQLDSDDLIPVRSATLKWVIASPRFTATAFDGRGMPVTMHTIDPRAFVLHKLYVSKQPDRSPEKKIRDKAQASAMANLLAEQMPDLPGGRAIRKAFPAAQSQQLDELDL
ncbi:GSU2403 family nucleotidyltransferase fold protein [Ferrimonas marina]|uniref:Nucleotidyltransferase-like domain-containing protein n=1 Tax=Ferrimonas marina TaxID=299255 RepID=A0A1M5TM50_9GAMM|nr:GSU2403 family nucleotidyltransferase fold protein [Ferrimonas marina]SHH51852.1 hypothetical protein SAMN02745129_2202 [Ferrimonas marina]